jgi:lipid-A-disaccharide synthase
MNRLFVIAGEISGDTHGAGFLKALKERSPTLEVAGLGGPKMRAVAGEGIEDWVETAGVVGLWEVLKMYGYFKRRFDEVVQRLLEEKPDAVVLVDYPGFNLRVAKALRAGGFEGKLIYYISPQVWAWKKGRVKTMAKVLDLMICIFPFEKPFYEKSGLKTEFAGHPMVDRAKELKRDWPRDPGLVGWFPGSRRNEVRRLFPVMLQAAQRIRKAIPEARFAVSAANEALASEMRAMAEAAGMEEAKAWIEVGTVYDLMQRAQVGAVASGTATLEAACLGLPYALVYKVTTFTYLAAKFVVRIQNLGMVNILAGRNVVPELVQGQMNAGDVSAQLIRWLENEEERSALTADLKEVVATLGKGGAYDRAADVVLECLKS